MDQVVVSTIGEDAKARPIYQPSPVYPPAMSRAGTEGRVMVEFDVGTDGLTSNVYAVQSTHPAFDESAVDALESWKFEPALAKGRPVPMRMRVLVNFVSDTLQAEPWRLEHPEAFPADLPEDYRWDQAPRLVGYVPPVYPREALVSGREGVVTVAFDIGPSGRVTEARALGSAHPDMQAAAIAAVEAFEFEPASKEGVPCRARVEMDFRFDPRGRFEVPVSTADRRLAQVLVGAPSEIVPLGRLDAAPKPLSRKPPDLPLSRRGANAGGDALVEFIIDRRGFARLPRVVEATSPDLGDAAVSAVATWRFEAPRQNGRTVDALVRVPIRFATTDTPTS